MGGLEPIPEDFEECMGENMQTPLTQTGMELNPVYRVAEDDDDNWSLSLRA